MKERFQPVIRVVLLVLGAVVVANAVTGLLRFDLALEHARGWDAFISAPDALTPLAQLRIETLFELVLEGMAGLLGLVLAWKAGRRASILYLAAYLIFLCDAAMTTVSVGISYEVLDLLSEITMIASMASLLRFAALFPRPLAPSDLAAASRRGRAGPIRSLLLKPTVVGGIAAALGGGFLAGYVFGLTVASDIALFGSLAFTLVAIGYSVVFLRVNYERNAGERREQILWIVQGFYTALWVLGIGMLAWAGLLVWREDAGFTAEHGLVIPPYFWTGLLVVMALAMLVIFVSLAVAIFYHGAVGASLVVRKTTVYGIVTVTIMLGLSLLQSLFASSLLNWLGLTASMQGCIVGGIIGFTLRPLHQRVENVLNARMRRAPVPAAREPTKPASRAA